MMPDFSLKYFTSPTIIIAFILMVVSNCRGPSAADDEPTLQLEDVSSTEVWLKAEGIRANELTLERDGRKVENYSIINESTIYVDSLQPNTTYTYQAIYRGNKSEEVTATTLDTTGNDFTWHTYTFGGEAGSSVLHDVAIINDHDIWAVGGIYLKDSTGQPDPESYGIAHWNGSKWKLKKITYNCRLYYPNCGPDTLLSIPAYSVFAFGPEDVWVAAGSIHHFDGSKWTEEAGIPAAGNANKIWGVNGELWFVGGNGFIAHRSKNGQWQKIKSGTDLQFLDIYGAKDPETGKLQILAPATQNYPPKDGLFRIQGNTATKISTKFDFSGYTIPPELFGVWFIPNRHYYLVGSGVYEKHTLSDSTWKNGPLDITHYGTTKIRGPGLNDLFVVGAFGEFVHFNGARWKSFRYQTALENGSYTSVAVKGNVVIAVGENNPQAVITIGKRSD